ncbi:MAG TPA: serine protease, partial [Allocoleopsis sp.]
MLQKNIKKRHFKLIHCGLFGFFTAIIPLILPWFFDFNPDLSVTEIRAIATKITVQVFSQDQPIGTGFIFEKNNNVYRVLTNHHVIEDAEKPLKIKTFDGKIYTANQKKPQLSKNDDDLAILEFQTSKNINYQIAEFAPGQMGDNVYAGGFPVVLNDDFNQISPTPLKKETPIPPTPL